MRQTFRQSAMSQGACKELRNKPVEPARSQGASKDPIEPAMRQAPSEPAMNQGGSNESESWQNSRH